MASWLLCLRFIHCRCSSIKDCTPILILLNPISFNPLAYSRVISFGLTSIVASCGENPNSFRIVSNISFTASIDKTEGVPPPKYIVVGGTPNFLKYSFFFCYFSFNSFNILLSISFPFYRIKVTIRAETIAERNMYIYPCHYYLSNKSVSANLPS